MRRLRFITRFFPVVLLRFFRPFRVDRRKKGRCRLIAYRIFFRDKARSSTHTRKHTDRQKPSPFARTASLYVHDVIMRDCCLNMGTSYIILYYTWIRPFHNIALLAHIITDVVNKFKYRNWLNSCQVAKPFSASPFARLNNPKTNYRTF